MHARFLVLFLALVCAACGPLTFASGSSPSPSSPPVAAAASFVHQLTDDNFEHETQASTGSTTGDWFVEFYAPVRMAGQRQKSDPSTGQGRGRGASRSGHRPHLRGHLSQHYPNIFASSFSLSSPRLRPLPSVDSLCQWCGHCQSLAPVWNELASWCRDEKVPVTIAMLDATSSVRTAKRLDIRSFPSLKLISRGVVYDYHGPRTLQALQQFVENRAWLAEGVTSRPMPAEMGAGDYLRDASKQVWNDLLLLSQRKPAAAITLVVTGLVIGVIVSMIVYILFIESAPVVHRLATQPTGAAALETTPAGAGEAARARTDRQTRTSARSQTQSTKKDE